jgi:hypothetical protein
MPRKPDPNRPPPDPIAVALAAKRRQIESACVVCGQSITATTRRRYCSPRCSQQAYRDRQRNAAPPDAPRSGAEEETP